MSQETTSNTENQRFTNNSNPKLTVWNPRTITADYTNSSYDEAVFVKGTVFGRKASTGKILPLNSAATDGSQYPVGVLLQDATIEEGDSKTLTLVVEGDIPESLIVLPTDGDTLDTVVESKTIRDRIGSDTVGIKLVGGVDLTNYDNS